MPTSQKQQEAEAIHTYKVTRRFSDFEAFLNFLQGTVFCQYLLPPLPDKHIFLHNYL
jgi:hypothetical protein